MLSAQILAMQQLTPATARVIVSDEVSIQSDGEAYRCTVFTFIATTQKISSRYTKARKHVKGSNISIIDLRWPMGLQPNPCFTRHLLIFY